MKPILQIAMPGWVAAVLCCPILNAPASAYSAQSATPTAPPPIYQQHTLPQEVRWFDGMNHLVDLHLKDATAQMAAEALSKASGVTIRVDSSVPSDLRLTLDAHQVPLATVLEAIGEQASLEISPERSIAPQVVNGVANNVERRTPQSATREVLHLPAPSIVILKAWPNLTLNNRKLTYRGPMAPWDDVWAWSPSALILGNGSSVEIPDGFFAVVGVNGNVVLGQRPRFDTGNEGVARSGGRFGGGGIGGGFSGGFGGDGKAAGGGGFGGFGGRPAGAATDHSNFSFGGSADGLAGTGVPGSGRQTFGIDAAGNKVPFNNSNLPAITANGTVSAMSKSSVQLRTAVPLRDMTQQFHSDGPMTITRLSDLSFVVTEPVTATNGDRGVILTVYELKNGQLQRVTGAYHPTAKVEAKQKKRP